jgi:ClpX C4-type zinc finger
VANMTERVRRFPRCRACHPPRGAGRRLIAGPGVYICESCIALLATRASAADTTERCSFCGRCNVPIAGAWPSLAICAPCIELSHGILAEDVMRPLTFVITRVAPGFRFCRDSCGSVCAPYSCLGDPAMGKCVVCSLHQRARKRLTACEHRSAAARICDC